MKTLIITVLSIIFLSGCVTSQCPSCPQTDVIILTYPYGTPIRIKKGFFDNTDNFYTIEEWLQKYEKELKEDEQDEPEERKEGPAI